MYGPPNAGSMLTPFSMLALCGTGVQKLLGIVKGLGGSGGIAVEGFSDEDQEKTLRQLGEAVSIGDLETCTALHSAIMAVMVVLLMLLRSKL